MKTLRFKLTSSFLLVTLAAIAVIGILANVLLESQFKKYVIGNLNQKNSEIVATLETRYTAQGNRWDVSGIENIGMEALSDGLIIRVSGESGTVVWDAMTHNSGMCAQLLQDMARNMRGRSLGVSTGYTEKKYSLSAGGSSVGTVTIGYYGPYFYTDNDLSFLNTLNRLLFLAAAVTAALSLVLGTYMAKRLSEPISRVIGTAEQISGGNYAARAEESSNTREIMELTNTVNALAETLGRHELLQKRLTADVAHELRTPIANLQSHLEAMIDGIWAPDPDRLQSCHDEAVRLSGIVGDLETLARYDGENTALHRERCNLADLVKAAAAGFESPLRNRRIFFTLLLTDQFVEADRDKVTRIVVNILSNALKYTDEGGKIEVAVEGDTDIARVRVRDTGIGISPEDLPFIFERFYRADKSRSRATGGSGIGLAIAKSLAEAHGGTIEVTSEPGAGSEFTVSLPKEAGQID